jgi:hypothetical protein
MVRRRFWPTAYREDLSSVSKSKQKKHRQAFHAMKGRAGKSTISSKALSDLTVIG